MAATNQTAAANEVSFCVTAVVGVGAEEGPAGTAV